MNIRFLVKTLGLLLVGVSSPAMSQEIVNGEAAKAFFSQFKNTSPEKLTINFDRIWLDLPPGKDRQISARTQEQWRLSEPDANKIWIAPKKGARPVVGVDTTGRRYVELADNGFSPFGFYVWLLGGRDTQFSDAFPASAFSNRVSFLVQGPDSIMKDDGTIVDGRTDPIGFMRLVNWEKGSYNQGDGENWIDSNTEARKWHIYYWPSEYWPKDGPFNVKFEHLGNNMQRITFNDVHTGTRTDGWNSPGQFGPTDPELAAFEGDITTDFRSETRYYFGSRTPTDPSFRFYGTDPDRKTPSVFDDGESVIRLYGVSYWYEDDEVEVVARTPEKPEGTSVVKFLHTDAQTQLDFPMEIKNRASVPASYKLAINGFGRNVPSSDPTKTNYLRIYLDSNGNGVLDANEQSTRLGSTTATIPAKGSLKCIARVDMAEVRKQYPKNTRNTPPRDTRVEFHLSVHLQSASDPMTLKGASLKFIAHWPLDPTQDLSALHTENLFVSSDENISKPPNKAPQAIIRATMGDQDLENGRCHGDQEIQNGATVQAGSAIRLESIGIDPDEKTNSSTMGHRFYTPEGYSYVRTETIHKVKINNIEKSVTCPPSITPGPWKLGENTFLLHVGDGYSRAFADFKIQVVAPATKTPPKARIQYPVANAQYPMGVDVFFGAEIGQGYNEDSDGGRAGTKRGITSFMWDFGDGNTSGEQYPEHKYTKEGSYTVKLTVTDDENQTTTVDTSVVITEANIPPVARIDPVQLESFREFGLLEVTAAGSTDPNANSEIVKYSWRFEGPNGYSNNGGKEFAVGARYLFTSVYPGEYTVYLTVQDKWGAKGSTRSTVSVKPWDGVYRVNSIGNVGLPGNDYAGWDIDAQVIKGWTPLYGGQGVESPKPAMGRIADGKSVIVYSGASLAKFENKQLPAGTPPELAGIFASAAGPLYKSRIAAVENLPSGAYDVTAYLYDAENAAPGTKYAVKFGSTSLELTVPENPTYENFIVKGVFNHQGGNFSVNAVGTAETDPKAPLAGFTLKRQGDAPPPPPPPDPSSGIPSAPRNLRISG